MPYTCLIIDDEAPARALITDYCNRIPDIEVVSACKNPLEAAKILKTREIDILFLDVEMPGISGIDFLKLAGAIPATVLITAHEGYAVEGFDLDVVDYLLKPVEFSRFEKAVEKLAARLNPAPVQHGDHAGAEALSSLFIKCDGEIVKIDVQDILFVESQREYVEVVTADKKWLTLQSLSRFELALPDDDFFRVHRSYIVRLSAIDKIIGNTIFIGSHRVVISKGQKKAFLQRINDSGLF